MAESTGSTSRTISIVNLLIDLENPRTERQQSQRDAIRNVIAEQGTKILNLAEDIVNLGLSAADRFIVMPTDDEHKRFVVLDGNRRAVALKILNEPELASGELSAAGMTRLRRLARRFENSPIVRVEAAIYGSREEAAPWIERRHQTEMDGVGLVRWGSTEQQRYAMWRGVRSPALQIVDFVREHGSLDEGTRQKTTKLSTSNLSRLVNDPDIRERLGVDKIDEQIVTTLTHAQVLKGLQKVVEDLAHKRINVTHIEHKADRAKYVSGFKKSELPNFTGTPLEPHVLGAKAKVATDRSGTGKKDGTSKTSRGRSDEKKLRSTIIPHRCVLNVEDDRINRIYVELKQLDSNNLPNAAAVLMRVFIELSVDEYIERHSIIQNEQQRRNAKLGDKLSKVAKHMEDRGAMSNQQLMPVRRATADKDLLAISVTTFHQYLHNRHFSPIPSELRTAWDDLQPFMEEIWR